MINSVATCVFKIDICTFVSAFTLTVLLSLKCVSGKKHRVGSFHSPDFRFLRLHFDSLICFLFILWSNFLKFCHYLFTLSFSFLCPKAFK